MNYTELRNEVRKYYSSVSYQNAKKYLENGTEKLDGMYHENMSSYDMKVMQYKTIADIMEPVLFEMRRSILKRELFRDFRTVQEIITETNISAVGRIGRTSVNLSTKTLHYGNLAAVSAANCFI